MGVEIRVDGDTVESVVVVEALSILSFSCASLIHSFTFTLVP